MYLYVVKEINMEYKQYMFTFEEGGWNTVWARTIRGARSTAIKQYADNEDLNPKISSLHLATKEGLRRAMSNFY